MLENDLYRLVRCERLPEAAGYAVEATLDPRHAVYGGHFPGHPVTPGVCLLEIVRTGVGRAIGRPVSFVALRSCKFLAPVVPAADERLRLSFTMAEDTGEVRCTAVWQERTVLKLVGTVVPARP